MCPKLLQLHCVNFQLKFKRTERKAMFQSFWFAFWFLHFQFPTNGSSQIHIPALSVDGLSTPVVLSPGPQKPWAPPFLHHLFLLPVVSPSAANGRLWTEDRQADHTLHSEIPVWPSGWDFWVSGPMAAENCMFQCDPQHTWFTGSDASAVWEPRDGICNVSCVLESSNSVFYFYVIFVCVCAFLFSFSLFILSDLKKADIFGASLFFHSV